MAGLLAARALSDFYRTVTVVERDDLPCSVANRRGVPQGRHVHALFGRGGQIIDGLLPGLLGEWAAGGGTALDDGDFSRFYVSIGGHLLVRSGVARQPEAVTYLSSRPFLEYHVRRRVLDLPNVVTLAGHEVVDLTANAAGTRVTGTMTSRRTDGETLCLEADLVVDATGRGSRTPALLERMGYRRPPEDHVVMRTCYASQQLRMAPSAVEPMVVIGAEPGRYTGMFLSRYEDDRWMFTAWGMLGHEPPEDFAGMVSFVAPFAPRHILAALTSAEPVDPTRRHRMPSSQWRRYDKLQRFPEGMLVTGDAISSFNPVYGQGMTVAALDAVAMHRALSGGTRGLARRYFRTAAKSIGVAWRMAAENDLGFAGVTGRRTVRTRVTHRCADWILAACESDPVVAEKFFRVNNFYDPPRRLAAPAFVAGVVAAAVRRGPKAGDVQAPTVLATGARR